MIAAHEAAVSVSLGYLEANAAEARIATKEGTRHVWTGNLLIARFLHDTSRALDPQLHTHAVVLNATLLADAQPRALANEELLRSMMVAGAIYRAERAETLRVGSNRVQVSRRRVASRNPGRPALKHGNLPRVTREQILRRLQNLSE